MKSKFDRFVVLICALALFMQPLFFSTMGLLGFEYKGYESSSLYVVYIVLIAALNLLAYLYATFEKGILKTEAILLLGILVMFALHGIWVVFDPLVTVLIPEYLIFFLLFGFPGFLSAATVIKLMIVRDLVRMSEFIIVLIATGIVIFSVIPSLAGVKTASLAGANYQTLSYYAAFTSGMLLSYNLLVSKVVRYSITSKIWYKSISYLLMLGCVTAVFVGGGRGAFLLLLFYGLLSTGSLVVRILKLQDKRNLLASAYKLMSIALVAIAFISILWEKELVQSGFQRATQFISAEKGIDIEKGSSGRDAVYQTALEFIEKRPILGYGPFSAQDSTLHPHNLFLEVWLQFGIIGLWISVLGSVVLIIRAIKHRSQYTIWLLSLALYPIVMLMFSSMYMHTSLFIFAIAFIVMFGKKKNFAEAS